MRRSQTQTVFVCKTHVGNISRADHYGHYVPLTVWTVCCWRYEQYLPSLTAASVVWCGRPVSTWTAGAPPQCRHTFPRYPGLNCTPAMIPLDLLATPEDKGVDKLRKKCAAKQWCCRRKQQTSPNSKCGHIAPKRALVFLYDKWMTPYGMCILAKTALHSLPCGHQPPGSTQCIF